MYIVNKNAPSFHSLVAGWMKPNNSSVVSAFGFKSFHTTLGLWLLWVSCNVLSTWDLPVPAFPITNTEWRTASNSSSCTTYIWVTLVIGKKMLKLGNWLKLNRIVKLNELSVTILIFKKYHISYNKTYYEHNHITIIMSYLSLQYNMRFLNPLWIKIF